MITESIKINGPHRLDYIDYYIQEKIPGVFALSNDGERYEIIGRSDTDVKEAIMKMAGGGQRGVDVKYAYFWFAYTSTAKRAFSEHCKLWHRYRPTGRIETHPTPPADENWGCPIEDCNWNAQNGRKPEEYY